jgi:CRISPR system Cascade subunit CasB
MTRRHWHRYVEALDRGAGRPDNSWIPGTGPEDLAVLRSGLGREAGTVPKLWRYYSTEIDDDVAARSTTAPPALAAEHAALALFGLHQRAKTIPMHKEGVAPGAALLALRRNTDKVSPDALDRRVAIAVSSTSVDVLCSRLRGLVEQLRSIDQPWDYDKLYDDLHDWHYPQRRHRVRRRWALAYRTWTESDDPAA